MSAAVSTRTRRQRRAPHTIQLTLTIDWPRIRLIAYACERSCACAHPQSTGDNQCSMSFSPFAAIDCFSQSLVRYYLIVIITVELATSIMPMRADDAICGVVVKNVLNQILLSSREAQMAHNHSSIITNLRTLFFDSS